MARTKRQSSTLPLLVYAILLLSTANAIGSLTTEKDHIVKDSETWTKKATDHRVPKGGPKTEKPVDGSPEMIVFEENCNTVDDEEECMMRHEPAALVDYIYTQQHNP